jgi:hypothetical protein
MHQMTDAKGAGSDERVERCEQDMDGTEALC